VRLTPEQRAEIRREARAELWRRREVWPLLEVYLDRDQLEDMRAFMDGGDAGRLPSADWCDDISRQRGKSWKWTVFCVVWCHCVPGQQVKYLAQFGTSVRGIIAPTISQLLEDMPAEYRPKHAGTDAIHVDHQDHKWTFPHPSGGASVLHATGANNKHYKSLRGPRAHLLVQDECAFYDDFDDVQAALRPMLITTGGACVYATTPPETPAHPYEATCAALKASGRYVHRTIHNHPRLTERQIEDLLTREATRKGMTLHAFKRTTYYRREFLCLHVVEETRAVVPEWSMAAQDVDDSLPEGVLWGDTLLREVERPRFADTYTFSDFGFTRDPSAVLFAWWDFTGARLVVEDETPPLHRTRTDKLAEAYREKCRALWPTTLPQPFDGARRSEDGTYWEPYMAGGDQGGRGEEVLGELAKEHGLHWVGANKTDLEIRVNEVRRIVAAGKVVVHPRCKHLRKQLAHGLWADRAKSDFERSAEGHLDHLAALVDLVSILDRQRNPVPVGYGVDTAHVVTVRQESRGTGSAIEAAF
jgi:hypothetical protein